MSFRSKTRETLERGKEERGDFTPKADSVPVKMYNYWLNESNSKKARAIRRGERRENFCHYWRVVAIWAPLRFLFNKGGDLLTNSIFLAVLATVAVVGFIFGAVTVDGWMAVVLACIGYTLEIATFVAIMLAIGFVLTEIIPKKFPRFTARWQAFWSSRNTWLTILGLAIAFAVVYTSWGTGFVGPFIWLAVFAGLGILSWAIVWAIDYNNGKRALKQEEWDALDSQTQMKILDWELAVWRIGRKPSKFEKKVRAFFSGIGDFFVFIIQVVRVNKWKICPLVEIPKETEVV